MKLSKNSNDWDEKLAPILKKYENKKYPLDYHNLYQLLVMVILSARDTDAKINKIAPGLFKVYPNMESLSVSNVGLAEKVFAEPLFYKVIIFIS